MSVVARHTASALALASLAFALGCNQKANAPEKQQHVASSVSNGTSPWRMELKVSPEHPSMAKPLTFMLHITDEHGQPLNDAEVNGVLTMKSMDMGTTQVRFTAKGNGDYEASLKDMDMSGAWNLTVDAVQGTIRAKKSFEFTVYD